MQGKLFTIVVTSLVLSSTAMAGNQGTPAPSKRSKANTTAPDVIEIQIGVANIASGKGRLGAPLQELSDALGDHEKASHFRVMWTMQLENVSLRSTVLYDRRSQSLKYFESGRFYGAPVRESWLYSLVNDDVLQRLAAKHRAPKVGKSDSFFSELIKMGCKRHRL